MLSLEKLLKVPPRELRSCEQSYKDMLKKQTQSLNILSLLKKKVKINDIATNVGNLEVDSPKVV